MSKLFLAILLPTFIFSQGISNENSKSDNQIIINNNLNSQQDKNNEDIYNDGVYSAKLHIKTNSFSIKSKGFATGLFIPLIGPVIGGVVAKNRSVEIPDKFVAGLSSTDRMYFEDGFTDYYRTERKKKYKRGALWGELALVLIWASQQED